MKSSKALHSLVGRALDSRGALRSTSHVLLQLLRHPELFDAPDLRGFLLMKDVTPAGVSCDPTSSW